ncbi:agamous-like MADS-box protein AGL80 [Vicia villosa]|uniref:agamous-like MADS-box protein AGL80 n=1 Tax=Vicia villosa TaxID=3911 RepID=UPI00273B31AB|nr:agamous-like MADS-box protein AGL80 [Vicia villosa]
MVDEITTLCGVEACVLIYGPYDPQLEIWPSPHGVEKVLSKFKEMPEFLQSKKMLNQETFLKQRVLKVKEQLIKQMRDNREKEMTMYMFECLYAGNIVSNNTFKADLNNLSCMIDMNLKHIDRRLDNNINSQVGFEMPQLPPQASASQNGHEDEEILFRNEVNLENEFWSNLLP